ncbi:MAG: hypothetical protein MZV70_12415 [Desulfobacterales bacterium]|nr:hypothetical protein [Desulfobacterales bacterium]
MLLRERMEGLCGSEGSFRSTPGRSRRRHRWHSNRPSEVPRPRLLHNRSSTTRNSHFLVEDIKRAYRILAKGEDYIVADVDSIKGLDFHYEYPFLQETASLDGVPVAGILDMAAMKLIAAKARGTKRDFIDLFFIMQEHSIL